MMIVIHVVDVKFVFSRKQANERMRLSTFFTGPILV